MKDFQGQAAFVTGGASGIGFATAQALAKRGARLILADIVADKAEAAAADLRAAGAEAIGLALNVADEADWARAGEVAMVRRSTGTKQASTTRCSSTPHQGA